MNFRELKLKSGKVVTLDTFNMSFTYEGILLGSPDKELNELIIKRINDSFNGNKVLFLLDDAYKNEKLLKPMIFSARLTSKPIDKMNDESYLNVVWFGDDLKTITIEKMIRNLKKFDWKKEAEDYQF
jgi:hypothetical protein